MARPDPAAQSAQGDDAATHATRGHRERVCEGRRSGGLAGGSPAAEAERERVQRGSTYVEWPTRWVRWMSGSSPTRLGGVKAELRLGAVVLGGGDELRWMTVVGGKS
jgi:hypothetical protein